MASRYGFSLVSLSLRRAWIEIFSRASSRAETCRSPYGERGLKSRSIEIFSQKVCRSPYGERGLKFDGDLTELAGGAGRSPYGERGLK